MKTILESGYSKMAEIIHFSQRNNKLDPWTSCFRESVAMAIVNNGIEFISPAIRNLIREFDGGDLFTGLFLAEFGDKDDIYYWNKQKELAP